MAVAMIYPEPETGGRERNRKLNLPFSKMSLSQARIGSISWVLIFPDPLLQIEAMTPFETARRALDELARDAPGGKGAIGRCKN